MCLLLATHDYGYSLLLTPKEYETSRRTKMGSSRSYHLPKVVQSTIPLRNSSIQFPGFSSWGQLNREEVDENREVERVREHRNTDFVLDKPTTAKDDFLSVARRLVDQGQPSQALQTVLCVFLFHFFLYFTREREEGRVRSDLFWVGG